MIRKLFFTATFIFPFVMNSQCNLNFESGSFTGWSGWTGTPSSTTNYLMTGCCAPGNSISTIVSTPATDPYLGTLPQSPLGGSFVAKVHAAPPFGNSKVSRITNTFVVSAGNTMFQFAISAALNGFPESCAEIAYAHVRLLDNLGTPFYSTHYVPVGPNTATCSSAAFTNTVSGVAFFCWQTYSVNLAPYIGTNVSVEVTAGNCGFLGHFAYCYFDAACSATTPTPATCPMTTSVKEIIEMELINVWPNPAKDFLNINIETTIIENEFIIHDVLGKVVFRQKNLKPENKIEIEKLLPGTYIYKLVGIEEIKTGKFIKE